ncbi:uncharacterized protein BDR25DRAFT_334810 [Lindgomyces ingoldianus]|uniref:Uncharacterized protein n=1 Tax=Lindgomyces ingoldianus TaxID=673940 RepID=A0ACB6QTW8_9PLEO|nr:uncharacterized protein BDR25DRAFT_334810 [Lindgomyces ingoldianus]KAF2469537.1 hypothetical protein BDR25DRAFT_334810 [Lindgomyces ingoldianus]
MPDLSWKETRPGRWERPQSCLEKINLINRNVAKAPDRDNWAKTAVVKLEFSTSLGDPEAALRSAWKQVRYNYPEMAAFPYDDQVALWVAATFSVCPNTTVDELFGHIPRNEQMMCYYLPDTSEVLVRSPHYRLDARGAVFCLNYLIESLANLDPVLIFGGCAKNLSPSIDSALNIPYEYTPTIERAAMRRLAALKPRNPPLELSPTIMSHSPGATRRRFIKLSVSESQAVMTGCASGDMDLTAALHAALVATVAKLAPPSELCSFMASFHCDLRFLISEPVTTKWAPTSCTSVVTSEVDVSPSTTFKDIYTQLASVYASGYGPYWASTACFHEQLAKVLASKDPDYSDDRAAPRFGPLGDIDEQLKKDVTNGLIRVKDFWLGGETLTKRKIVHSWIWERQIHFSCCYNESFWEDEFVEGFLEQIRDVLLEEVALREERAPTMNIASSARGRPASFPLLFPSITNTVYKK